MNINKHSSHPTRAQTGSALIVSLLILLVMTLIGVTAMSSSNLEEKMAGNSRDKMLAFQAAEAALRQGEDMVANLVTIAPFSSCGGTYLYDQGCKPDVTLDGTWATAKSYTGTIDKVKTNPKYIIEYTGEAGSSNSLNIDNYGDNSIEIVSTFRVTARGTGGSDNSVVLLQSYHGKIL